MMQSKSAIVVIAFVLAALVLTIGGCTVGGGGEEYRDPGVTIVVEKGNEFVIVLQSNPTTGYQWKLAEQLNEDIITLVKTEYKEPDTELLGAPGEEHWTFKGMGLGETNISLTYVRPWEVEEEQPGGKTETETSEHSSESAESSESTAQEETAGQSETSTSGEETSQAGEEEQATSMTFHVKVVKKGTVDKEAKKYEDENAPIEVEENLEFAIVLESNPSTGYSWQLAQPLDESIVELVGTAYEKKGGAKKEGEGEGEALGAAGEEVWTFKAVGAGETKIQLEYLRSWEKDVPPQEEKTFSVTVTKMEESSQGEK